MDTNIFSIVPGSRTKLIIRLFQEVLFILADFTGLNFVVPDNVKGEITLPLNDVPWDQALDIIVISKRLTKKRSGNVIITTDERKP